MRIERRRMTTGGKLHKYSVIYGKEWIKYVPENFLSPKTEPSASGFSKEENERIMRANGKWLIFGSRALMIAVSEAMVPKMPMPVRFCKYSVEAIGGHHVVEVFCSAHEKEKVLTYIKKRFAGAQPRWKTSYDTAHGVYSEEFLKAKTEKEKSEASKAEK